MAEVNPGKQIFNKIAAHSVPYINSMKGKDGLSNSLKAMVVSGLAPSTNRCLEEGPLKPELQNTT